MKAGAAIVGVVMVDPMGLFLFAYFFRLFPLPDVGSDSVGSQVEEDNE